jgi:hypothetical protein
LNQEAIRLTDTKEVVMWKMFSTLTVLALASLSLAQSSPYNPVTVDPGATISAQAGQTVYVQLSQSPEDWGLSQSVTAGTVDRLDSMEWFSVLSDGLPAGWQIQLASVKPVLVSEDAQTPKMTDQKSEIVESAFVNTYSIQVPAGLPAGTYTLSISVVSNVNGEAYSFPLTLTVS